MHIYKSNFIKKCFNNSILFCELNNYKSVFFSDIERKIKRIDNQLIKYDENLYDTISLYFEVSNNSVKVNFFLTNQRQFMSLFNQGIEYSDNRKLLIECESAIFSRYQLFMVCYELSFYLNDFINLVDLIHTESLDDFVDTLNNQLYCVEYSCKRDDFYRNENLKDRIDLKIRNYRESFDGDIIEKPEFTDELKEAANSLTLRIFDVGQANCSALVKLDSSGDIEKVVSVFDIGCQKDKRSNQELNKMLSKINCETIVIISHFDTDHFNGIKTIDLNITNKWLFPEHRPEKYRASKLYDALLAIASRKSFSGSVYSYKTPWNLSPYLTIYQNTSGKIDPYQSTDENANSIVCSIDTGNQRILIPADSLYKEFHSDIFTAPYDLIIVPHHCCKYVSPSAASADVHNLFNKLLKENTIGIVMSGKNSYGHINLNHFNWYSNLYAFSSSKIYDDSKRILKIPLNNLSNDFFDFKIK